MSNGSAIEWTGATWNCVIGCTHTSEGCRHCYAEGQVHRFGARYDRPTTIKLGRKADALTRLPVDAKGKTLRKGAQWTGAVWLLPDVLELPLRRKKPTTYFVNSLADWAHESIVESEQGRRFLAAMFGVMAATPQHIYQLLTKRPEQARKWFEWLGTVNAGRIITGQHDAFVVRDAMMELLGASLDDRLYTRLKFNMHCGAWPMPNVWMGCSVEDQATKTRIDELRTLPAGLRFLSIEPLLEDLGELDLRDIDWVIVGGESGPKSRTCDVAWIRSVVEQCKIAGVPVFVKQLGAYATEEHEDGGPPYDLYLSDAKGGNMGEWPEDLRVREMPTR